MIRDMLHDGRDVETIARAVSKRRNVLRLEADADDPEAFALTKKQSGNLWGLKHDRERREHMREDRLKSTIGLTAGIAIVQTEARHGGKAYRTEHDSVYG